MKCIRWDCVYTSYRTFSGMMIAGSWSGLGYSAWSIRFLFERYQAGWILQQKVVESASLLILWGFPIMRTITATTVFKMPLNGISFLLSASSELLTEAGSWPNLRDSAWERSVFIWTLPSRLDFAAESCGIDRLAKFYGDPDHENYNCYDSI